MVSCEDLGLDGPPGLPLGHVAAPVAWSGDVRRSIEDALGVLVLPGPFAGMGKAGTASVCHLGDVCCGAAEAAPPLPPPLAPPLAAAPFADISEPQAEPESGLRKRGAAEAASPMELREVCTLLRQIAAAHETGPGPALIAAGSGSAGLLARSDALPGTSGCGSLDLASGGHSIVS